MNNRGITGLEVLAFSFAGSLICSLLVGFYAGYQTKKFLNKFTNIETIYENYNLIQPIEYNEIQIALGYDSKRSM